MGRYILILIGIVGPFAMVVYRETLGDMIGEAPWMKKVGGIYNVILIVAFFFFFWSLAELTGTTGFLFAPIKMLFPNLNTVPPPSF